MLPHMLALIAAVRDRGFNPVIIYNSGGYDSVDSLRRLEDVVDIYLPDCKYMDQSLAARWSVAADYPQAARAALKEMYRQKGNILHLDEKGQALRGMIVRHLVLPGMLDNTRRVLEFIAEELSPKLHLSLMSQYYPNPAVATEPLFGRPLLATEYYTAKTIMEELGFMNGWAQDFTSAQYYNPDFERKRPEPRSQPRGQDHSPHEIVSSEFFVSSSAFSAKASSKGSSFSARGRIAGFLEKFPSRCATVGGMKRRYSFLPRLCAWLPNVPIALTLRCSAAASSNSANAPGSPAARNSFLEAA
jgi:putative pyruvate formate lyase activating enzyme